MKIFRYRDKQTKITHWSRCPEPSLLYDQISVAYCVNLDTDPFFILCRDQVFPYPECVLFAESGWSEEENLIRRF